MPPHYPAENRMERDTFNIPMSPVGYYYRRPEYNILPSIESMFGRELGRPGGPIPPPTTPSGLSPPPHSGYSPESPTAMRAPGGAPAMSQYLSDHKNDPWGAYKQGHPPSVHYPGAHSHHQTIEYQQQQSSQRSPSSNGEFPDYNRRAPSWDSEHINRNRSLDRTTQPISPTTETTMDSHSNFESGTEIYSEDPGEMSEINSGMGDTQSQAGSTVSGLHMRQFSCKTCKSTFKCDSLRRKHEMKHTKPFKCQFPDCKRKGQGFTSMNDRDRHMNSVHKRHLSRPAVGYDCCYDHCRDNGKIFWRLDNFRNHLKKKHDPKGSKDAMEDFLKRAEAECRRIQPAGGDGSSMAISIDTRSEPECSSNRTMESPGPAMSIDFPRPTRRTRPLPQVPPFNNSGAWESASESGMAQAPISPVSRGPHPDVGSDSGDRMEIDEIPAATSQPMDEEPLLDTTRINDNHYHGHLVPNVPPERQDQGRESYAKSEARRKRHQQLEEMHEKIKEVRILLAEFNELCNEDLEDQWGVGNRYELIAIPFSASDDSDNTIPYHGPHYESSPQNISLGRFLTQDPAEESPMSRLLSSGGTASTPSSTTAQADTRQLVSPPISVASPPHAAATAGEVHPQHPHHQQQQQGQHNPIVIPDDEPMNPPLRSPKVAQRGPISQKNGLPGSTQSTHTLLPQNGKSTVCPECDKVFAMPSKLKKHMKRHSRPYACTFRGCGKLFGSKNDWKRHENSQHFQLELWKCGVLPPNTGALCGKLSFRRESHTTHLRSVHGITDKNEITAKTNEAHIGRNNFKTFWCGFCPTFPDQLEPRGLVVQLEKKGLGGWDERFDHLGKHFIDEGLKIGKYKFHDDDDQYGPSHDSGSEDEEEEEMTVGEASVVGNRSQPPGGGDEVLDDYGATNAKKLVAYTAPDGEKTGIEMAKEELGDPTTKTQLQQKPKSSSRSNMKWYCCQPCSDGPYIVGLQESCASCEHQICSKCHRE